MQNIILAHKTTETDMKYKNNNKMNINNKNIDNNYN